MELKTTKDKKGWLIPYLLGLDNLFFKRWEYWFRICMSNRLMPDPIPVIRFQPAYSYPGQEVKKNIQKCLDFARHISNPFGEFVDWVLWGFNQGESFPNIDEKTDDYWYRTFNLGLFYKEPGDHFADFAADYMGRNNKLGFFATPGHVVDMMVRMTFGGKPTHEHKTKSVLDPCCGTGGMLLYASNYSLNLYGNDISLLLTKLAKINAYIYVPWLVYKPQTLTIFDEPQEAIIEVELPTGIKVPQCTLCHDKEQAFLLDLETQHQLNVTEGLLSIDRPNLTKDVIAKRLKPENITCAHCQRQLEREAL